MPYWRCFYHVIWTTKYRERTITPTIERMIFPTIAKKCEELGCELLGVNGVEDHIHIALTMPPNIAVGQVIGQLKGATSHVVNHNLELETKFRWQTGYGVLTFGEKVMPNVLAYIENQKQHHANSTTYNYLEHTNDD